VARGWGQHIQSFASMGMVAVRHKEVQPEDIERVIEAAKAVAIPQDRQVPACVAARF